MAYTPATQLPSLKLFQWSTPSYPNPRLAAPISATDTTLTFTSAPREYDGTVIAGNFLMGIKNDLGYVETIYVPANKVSVDGTTATDVVRGVRLTGLDYTTGDATLATAFNQDSPIFCNVSAVNYLLMVGAMKGTVASGGTTWKIGDGTDSDITVTAYNADGNKPYFKYDKATNQFIYSNDGVSSTPFGTGAGVTGGDGITVTAGDIDIDLTDTTIFKTTSAGAGDTGKAVALNASGLVNQSIVENWKDVTASSAELNQALDGINPAVTFTNLNTLVAGVASNADALHIHTPAGAGVLVTYTLVASSTYGTSYTAASAPTQRSTSAGTFVELKKVTIGDSGEYYVTFRLNGALSWKLKINGVQYDTDSDTYSASTTSRSITLVKNDILSLEISSGSGGWVDTFLVSYYLKPSPISVVNVD